MLYAVRGADGNFLEWEPDEELSWLMGRSSIATREGPEAAASLMEMAAFDARKCLPKEEPGEMTGWEEYAFELLKWLETAQVVQLQWSPIDVND